MMLLIGYIFQSALIVYIFMSLASLLIWIPSVSCYIGYSIYRRLILTLKIKVTNDKESLSTFPSPLPSSNLFPPPKRRKRHLH